MGKNDGCIAEDARGMVPNQSGTWWLGRGGWCPGEQVEPWIVDVTADAKPGTREFTIEVGSGKATQTLALQLAAPILVTMLVVDLALAFVGRTVPQLNVLALGLSLKPAASMETMKDDMSGAAAVLGRGQK